MTERPGMPGQDDQDGLARLKRVLEAFGPDPSRWPAREQTAIRDDIATNPEARRLVAEAIALETVLSADPDGPKPAVERVRARTLSQMAADAAKPAAQPHPVEGDERIVPFIRATTLRPASERQTRGWWREAIVLAAALMMGVFAGMQGVFERNGFAVPGLTPRESRTDDVSAWALGIRPGREQEEDLL